MAGAERAAGAAGAGAGLPRISLSRLLELREELLDHEVVGEVVHLERLLKALQEDER